MMFSIFANLNFRFFQSGREICLILLGASILFASGGCLLDTVEEVISGYRSLKSEPRIIPDMEVTTGLYSGRPIPYKLSPSKSLFLKDQCIWTSPYSFRIGFNDFKKKYDRARLISVHLINETGTWEQDLVPVSTHQGWRDFKPDWVGEYPKHLYLARGIPIIPGKRIKRIYFLAAPVDNEEDKVIADRYTRPAYRIIPPPEEKVIFADVVFELDIAEKIKRYEHRFKMEYNIGKNYYSYHMRLFFSILLV